MPEAVASTGLLLVALLSSLSGMGWLALSMPVHAQQVLGHQPPLAMRRRLRRLGAVALALALVLCLRVDHATMAVLVWVMTLTAAALSIAFTLSWRPRGLRWLAPWVRSGGVR